MNPLHALMVGEKAPPPEPWGGILDQKPILGPQPIADKPKPKMVFRPFNADESINNGDGSISTERTVTIQTPDGWANVPSLWMGPNGPMDLAKTPDPEGAIATFLRLYESQNGPAFGRFRSVEEAVSSAKARSEKGGAQSGLPRR